MGGAPGSMEPQQLSPRSAGTAAASEASSTNGGTAGITVTEPDTSTMQKQAAGLSTLICILSACKTTVLYYEDQKGIHQIAVHIFSTYILYIFIALIFIYC